MAHFSYRAIDAGDRVIEAVVEADDRDAAVNRLRSDGLLPLRLDPVAASPVSSWSRLLQNWWRRIDPQANRIAPAAVTAFARELYMLLDAGIGLDRSLLIVARSAESPAIAALAADLRQRIRTGESLSDALGAHADLFDDVFQFSVRAGETASALTQALSRLADWREARERVQASIRSALVYPTFLAAAALVSLLVLLIFVVPQFEMLFRQTGAEIPALTRGLIAASLLLRDQAVPILLVLVACLAAMRFRRRPPEYGTPWVGRLARLPLLRGLARRIAVERACGMLAILTANGTPLPEALELAATAAGEPETASALRAAAPRLREGTRLNEALRQHGGFPDLVLEMLAVGEESGALPDVLERLSARLRVGVEENLRRLVAIIEPSLIVLTGLLVASIILTLLSAIASVHALVI
jgi:general secretion pathway protein F